MKITREPIPTSQFAVKNTVYPKVSGMAVFIISSYKESHHMKRDQGWRKNAREYCKRSLGRKVFN